MPRIQLHLPTPYPLQKHIIDDPAKRKVICAGRRAGKTLLTAQLATYRFLQGQNILLTSATQQQADVFWDYCRAWLQPLIAARYVSKNETRRLLAWEGRNGRIRVKTAYTPDYLRGDHADLIVFDECALLDPQVWYAVAAPMLADRDGSAVFISTPRRHNWFYDLYRRAVDDDSGRWRAWHFPSTANPHLSPTALAELSQDMTEAFYRQEILAEFLAGAGAVFRKIHEAVRGVERQPYQGLLVFGLDWAQTEDYTAIVVLDVRLRQVVYCERFRGVDWALQRGRVAALAEKWHPALIIAEANSIGGPNIEALQAEGLPVRPFLTTSRSKPPLIESLALAFERGDLTLYDHSDLLRELEGYERTISAHTHQNRYGAGSGGHDDLVIALALAWHGAQELAGWLAPDQEEIYQWMKNWRG